MIASGLIDGSRVAIMGGSFGGYLAVSGVVNEPALYRCAISNAGVFDWTELIHEKNDYRHDSSAYDWLLRRLGDPRNSKRSLRPFLHCGTSSRFASRSSSPAARMIQTWRLPSRSDSSRPWKRIMCRMKRFSSAKKARHASPESASGALHPIEAFLDKYLKPATPVATAPERRDN